MQIPDTPLKDEDSPAVAVPTTNLHDSRPHIVIEGGNVVVNPNKRQKNSTTSWSFGSTTKRRYTRDTASRSVSPRSDRPLLQLTRDNQKMLSQCSVNALQTPSGSRSSRRAPTSQPPISQSPSEMEEANSMVHRRSRIRELVPVIIHDSLRVGGRPDSSIAEPTELGERIEVRARSSNGHTSHQIIEWSVQNEVPEIIHIDERDLTKLISCVFLNAIKFTESGTILVRISLSESLRSIRINVKDNGPGIPKDFLPALFKPFSREDDSITRSREGLGLGLLVGKGLARKLGGDLNVVSTETSGENQGSEFEIKVPIGGKDVASEPGTPFSRTPSPSNASPQTQRQTRSRPTLSCPKRGLTSTPSHTPTRTPNDSYFPPVSSDPCTQPYLSPRRISLSSKSAISHQSTWDPKLAQKHPLTFLVAEDNRIIRKLLVSMLNKFGYKDVYEAYDGREAVRVMSELRAPTTEDRRLRKPVDVVLMDIWMPEMDGYEATEKILHMYQRPLPTSVDSVPSAAPIVVAVSADVTEKAISRATAAGMEGFMTKPYKLVDLQRLIEAICHRMEQ